MSVNPTSIGFVTVVEPGDLEFKAVLLIESLRQFAGGDYGIWAVQPRVGRELHSSTKRKLASCGVRFVHENLNTFFDDYLIANKVYAAAHVEQLVAGKIEQLCLLDTDIVCMSPIDPIVLPEGKMLGVKPEDIPHLSLRVEDKPNDFWRSMYEIIGVALDDVWSVVTTVSPAHVRAMFNSGVVVSRVEQHFYQRWLANMVTVKRSDLYARQDKEQSFFFDQTVLAATVPSVYRQEQVQLFDNRCNYPLHYHHAMSPNVRVRDMGEIVFAHYHSLFSQFDWMDHMPVPAPQHRLLMKHLPLPDKWHTQDHRAATRAKRGVRRWIKRLKRTMRG